MSSALTDVDWRVLGDPVMIARLVLQVGLFSASAFFSMSETSLFSLRETDLRLLERRKHPQATHLRDLLADPRKLIVSILCGNELINIAATINLAGILLALYGDPQAAAIANTLVMFPLLLIFSEIAPKTAAVMQPVALCTRLVAPVLTVWTQIVAPLRVVIRSASDRLTTLFVGEAESKKDGVGVDEFQTLLRDVEKEGVVTGAERRWILNLIRAGTTEITRIMVPRPRVAFIDADLPVPEILSRFQRLRHRRVPLYRQQRDNIVGVLKDQNLLEVLAGKRLEEIELADIVEDAKLVPSTQTVSELAEFFKEGDHHAAIVVNEFGGVEGLVSADDVFGFLTLGDAIHLQPHAEIREVEGGVYSCSGLTPLDAFRDATNAPAFDERVSTVGGFLMSRLNRVPVPGDEVREGGLVYRVRSMDNLLIDEVLVAPQAHGSPSPEETEAAS